MGESGQSGKLDLSQSSRILKFSQLTFQQLYDYDSNFMIQLFHAVDPANPESFTSRGNVSVLSVNSGELITNQKALSQKDRQALIELSKNGKFYRMKAEVVGTDGIKTSFLTASKAVSSKFIQRNTATSLSASSF